VYTPLAKRHVLGNELELPAASTVVEERAHAALVVPEHERVEVWGGPEAEDGELSGCVRAVEGFDFAQEEVAVEGRGVLEMRDGAAGRDELAVIDVEVHGASRLGFGGCDARGFATEIAADDTCAEYWD
jgi:hypothetical protein